MRVHPASPSPPPAPPHNPLLVAAQNFLPAATRTLVRTIAKACAREGVAATRAVLDSLLEQCQEQYSLLTANMLATRGARRRPLGTRAPGERTPTRTRMSPGPHDVLRRDGA